MKFWWLYCSISGFISAIQQRFSFFSCSIFRNILGRLSLSSNPTKNPLVLDHKILVAKLYCQLKIKQVFQTWCEANWLLVDLVRCRSILLATHVLDVIFRLLRKKVLAWIYQTHFPFNYLSITYNNQDNNFDIIFQIMYIKNNCLVQ